jgi:RND family efflux transporter MFP subunit
VRDLNGQDGAVTVQLWGSKETLPATVREVAAATDPMTRTVLVKADIGRAPVTLGQTATVLIETRQDEDAIKLPLSALVESGGKMSVWLLDPAAMTVRPQPVRVLGADGNSVIVAEGLLPGQEVVTAGVHVLTPGQKVRRRAEIRPAPTVGAATPAASGASH